MSKIIEQPGNMIISWLGAGASVFGTISQDALLSIAGSAVAVGFVVGPPLIKLYQGWRAVQRTEDTADLAVWQKEVSPEVVKRAEFEGENNFLKRRVAELEEENRAQAIKMGQMSGAIKKVGTVAIENQIKVDAQEERIAAIEQVVPPSSSSNLNSPKA